VRTCTKPPTTKLYRKTNEEVKHVTKTFLKVRTALHCNLLAESHKSLCVACDGIWHTCSELHIT